MSGLYEGIIIGGAGGAVAGISVMVIAGISRYLVDKKDKDRVFNWMNENTSNEDGRKFRSTRAIASWNNLTEDRTRYICSGHTKIYLSTGDEPDRWSIHERDARPNLRAL